MVLTAYFVISPAIGLFCHRRPADMAVSAPGRADIASARLDAGVEASGPHDFTVRCTIVRLQAVRSLTDLNPPCHYLLARRCRVHRIPHPTFVTMANAPLSGRDGGVLKVIWVRRERKYF
jgi:hypothetical protein